MIGRRAFIAGAALVSTMPVRGQISVPPEVGFLSFALRDESRQQFEAFRKGLAEENFVEGKNFTLSLRSAEGDAARLRTFAVELIERRVAVIVAGGGALATDAVKRATSQIPIVFVSGADPIRSGLVSSLSRPGGNVTGIYFQLNEVVAKRLELLREIVPSARRIGILVNPDNSANADGTLREIVGADRFRGLQLDVLRARDDAGIEAAFAAAGAWPADALFVGPDAFFTSRRSLFAALTLRHRLPTSFSQRLSVEAGGLMSYGADLADSVRLAGVYAGRILKGEKPGDLPVMQPTKYELAINKTTARALGLDIPQSLAAAADELIE